MARHCSASSSPWTPRGQEPFGIYRCERARRRLPRATQRQREHLIRLNKRPHASVMDGRARIALGRGQAQNPVAISVTRNGDRSRGALRPAATLPVAARAGNVRPRLDGRARIALGRGQAQNPSAISVNSIWRFFELNQVPSAGLSFPCQGR